MNTFFMILRLTVATPQSIGVVPMGLAGTSPHQRRGDFEGPRLRGSVLPAAAELGLLRSASAQSKTPNMPTVKPGTFFPGFSAESVKTSATTIHVLRKGSGRPLLLLHGYPETHLTWPKWRQSWRSNSLWSCPISGATAIRGSLKTGNGMRTIHFAPWRRTK